MWFVGYLRTPSECVEADSLGTTDKGRGGGDVRGGGDIGGGGRDVKVWFRRVEGWGDVKMGGRGGEM